MSDTSSPATPQPTPTPTPPGPTPPTPPSPPPPEPSWVKPSIGIFSFVIFAAALFVTWKFSQTAAFNLLVGAVIANVTTVIGYYFGSSSGSAHKTALLATTLPSERPGGG
jgi:hypothetical protein